jgi:hypothetical protein
MRRSFKQASTEQMLISRRSPKVLEDSGQP